MTITRRSLLLKGGQAAALLSVGACGDESPAPPDTGSTFATGGTAGAILDLPDPFDGASRSCALTCSQGLGPCYADSPVRRDITEGKRGWPMRLALRLVGAEACAPIPGALVELWQTDIDGIYSGETPEVACARGFVASRSESFMRGAQTSDAAGRVDFDTIFPGHYAGRALHLHLRISVGGEESLTTQLYFPDALSEQVYAEHPDYVGRRRPETWNDSDPLLPDATAALPFIPETRITDEGVLHAWWSVALRSSTGEPLCAVI